MAHIVDWEATAEPHPEWQELVRNLKEPLPDLGKADSIQTLRKFVDASKAATAEVNGPEVTGVSMIDHEVVMRDGNSITCRVHAPTDHSGTDAPLMVMFHGGGWCLGDLTTEQVLCNRLAKELGVITFNVDYRLAPESKFPIPVYDCFDAMKWAVENAASFGANPKKAFLVGGTSAGGNLTAVMSHMARDEGISPPITGCLLMIPAVCDSRSMPERFAKDAKSWEQNKDAPILNRAGCYLLLDGYLKSDEDLHSPMLNPLNWTTGHKGLPPQAFQICGSDPLRDEALVYERLMREEEGIKTKCLMYPGLPHGFWSIFPMLKVSKKFEDESVDCVKWLLEQS